MLSFSFLFDRPAVDCSAVLAYYSQSYELARPVRTVEQEVLTVVADIIRRNSGSVRLVPVQQSLQAGSGLVLGSPATSALASRRLSITRGAEQNQPVQTLQLLPQTGQSADRLSLPQALDIGTIELGTDGFIDIVDPATINLDALPTFGLCLRMMTLRTPRLYRRLKPPLLIRHKAVKTARKMTRNYLMRLICRWGLARHLTV